jgi:hypothetical protein
MGFGRGAGAGRGAQGRVGANGRKPILSAGLTRAERQWVVLPIDIKWPPILLACYLNFSAIIFRVRTNILVFQ